MDVRFIGSGGQGHQAGGAGGTELEIDEWILRPGTNYLVRVTATSTTAVNASIVFSYYIT
jgi:hypothetical protein